VFGEGGTLIKVGVVMMALALALVIAAIVVTRGHAARKGLVRRLTG
jgi:hypothetical protein